MDFIIFQVEILSGDKEQSQFKWYRASLEEMKVDNWAEVGEGFVYLPKTEDIGCKLKVRLIPGNGSVVGPEKELITNTVVQAGPGHCPFETRHAFTSSRLPPDR
jgi:2',5'-phosphodiesterase